MNKASQVLVNLVKIKKITMDDGKKKHLGPEDFCLTGVFQSQNQVFLLLSGL